VPPLVSIAVALVSAAFFLRDVATSRERWGRSFEELRRAERVHAPSAGYRAHRVLALDPRAPQRLALASCVTSWWVMMGLVRLGVLVVEIPNLTDEPHRRLGLVPDGPSLVLVHGGLALTIFAALVGALRLRGWLHTLVTLARRAPFAIAIATGTLATLGAVGASCAVVLQTPMSLYWLHEIAASSAVYAACGAGVVVTLARAWAAMGT
jgi:hypothetical protein